VRLFNALRSEQLLLLEPCAAPLHAVQWSPFQPLVFAVAAGVCPSQAQRYTLQSDFALCWAPAKPVNDDNALSCAYTQR
jgi:hypothetical protein